MFEGGYVMQYIDIQLQTINTRKTTTKTMNYHILCIGCKESMLMGNVSKVKISNKNCDENSDKGYILEVD